MTASDAFFLPHGGRAARVACAAAFWLAAFGAAPGRAGDLSYFSGSFRGPGYMVEDNGARKDLDCRATGETAKDGGVLSQNIACESDSYRFDLRAQYVADGAEARGFWREATRGSSGAVSGRIGGQGFAGASEARGFSGRFKLHAGPRKLIFTFWPEDGKPTRIHASIPRQSSAAREETHGPKKTEENNGLELLN